MIAVIRLMLRKTCLKESMNASTIGVMKHKLNIMYALPQSTIAYLN